MLYPTTITQKWQMTIPKSVRKLLDITSPGKVFVQVQKKERTIMIKQSPSIFDLAGTYTPRDKKKIINAVKIRDYMETHYERT